MERGDYLKIQFLKQKVRHIKKAGMMEVVYSTGPDKLKSISFVDAVCIWAAVEHMIKNKEG